MKKILVIDDDIHIGNALEETLRKEGYQVARAYSGTEALLVLSNAKPDLILLDLMLPGLEGEQVLPHIKGIPVIVLSARTDPDEKAALLLGGAVDYVTKPFHTKELLARIAVHLRNAPGKEQAHVLSYQMLRLDTDSHMLSLDENSPGENRLGEKGPDENSSGENSPGEKSPGGKEVKLTRTETAILKMLMQNPAQVVTKSLLLDRISQDTPDCTESSLKMHISNLRRKIREAGGGDCIEAVWGIGFKLK